MRWLCGLLLAGTVFGCSGPARTGTRPDSKIGSDPLSRVEVVINGLSRSDAEAFRGQILAQGDVSEVVLKSYANNVATYELEVRGCECDLPAKIARIQSPGFRYQGRTSRLEYTAFDNQKPVVSFVHPESRVLTSLDQTAMVSVRDSDVDQVWIAGVKAQHFRGDVYLAKLPALREGTQVIKALARDKAGNEGFDEIKVTLNLRSTTEATVPMWVRGTVPPGSTVLVEGKDVPVDDQGNYAHQIPVAEGQREIQIIVVAPDGRKSVTLKELPAAK